MSDYRSLNELENLLKAQFDPRQILHGVTFGDPRVMAKVLKEIKRDLGIFEARPMEDLLIKAIHKFKVKGNTDTFTELKYVCYGVETPVGPEKYRVIEDINTFSLLLKSVEERNSKQLRRCYQGLLSSYFRFDPREPANKKGAENWVQLKVFLKAKISPIYKTSIERGTTPEWLSTLYEHKNLLDENPCKRYAESLTKGSTQDLQEVSNGLGIESSSWVWNEAFLAYVRNVCAMDDQSFTEHLADVLELVNGNGEINIPEGIAIEATAFCIIRYSSAANTIEHQYLRDTCVRKIGNPMLEKTKWDALVNHEPARQLVTSWLKQQLIKDFFELLAQDGAADVRRLNYWLKWEKHISEMWFFLGNMAFNDQRVAFVDVRERMGGSIRQLVEPSRPENNAFVMRIGSYLLIEFSTKNNAMFIYQTDEALPDMKHGYRTTYRLKNLKGSLGKYSHQSYWEGTFDQVLRSRLNQSVPVSKNETPVYRTPVPASTQTSIPLTRVLPLDINELQSVVSVSNAGIEDHRSKQGNLWVTLTDKSKDPTLAIYLESRGFKYIPGRGYWIK
jgi:EH_Signature domain